MIIDWFLGMSFYCAVHEMPRKLRSSLKFLNDRGKRGIVPLKYEAKVFGGQDKVAPNGRDWRIRYVKPSQKCYTAVEKRTKLRHCCI